MRWLGGIIKLHGYEFEQAPGDGEGQGNLTLQSMGLQSDMTESLDNN